jgi:hypothetical protein
MQYKMQCCGSGSGIRCFFDPWIQDPGWVKKSESGTGMNNPDHISESLETIFGVKHLNSRTASSGLASKVKYKMTALLLENAVIFPVFWIRIQSGQWISDFGSRSRSDDPQMKKT